MQQKQDRLEQPELVQKLMEAVLEARGRGFKIFLFVRCTLLIVYLMDIRHSLTNHYKKNANYF